MATYVLRSRASLTVSLTGPRAAETVEILNECEDLAGEHWNASHFIQAVLVETYRQSPETVRRLAEGLPHQRPRGRRRVRLISDVGLTTPQAECVLHCMNVAAAQNKSAASPPEVFLAAQRAMWNVIELNAERERRTNALRAEKIVETWKKRRRREAKAS